MKKVWKVVKYFLLANVALFAIGFVVLLFRGKPEVQAVPEKIEEVKPVEVAKQEVAKLEKPKMLPILLYEVVRGENEGRQKDLYVYLKEKPEDTLIVRRTLLAIAKSFDEEYVKQNGEHPRQAEVWLYTSRENASNENLKSCWIANYWINNESKDEYFMFSKERFEMMLRTGEAYSHIAKLKKYFSTKAITICDYKQQVRAFEKESYKKADMKYGNGNTEGYHDYFTKIVNEAVHALDVKNGISRSMSDEMWLYGDYACDNLF